MRWVFITNKNVKQYTKHLIYTSLVVKLYAQIFVVEFLDTFFSV